MNLVVEIDAQHYMHNSTSQLAQAEALLGKVLIQKDFSILDIGCGHGKVVAQLSRAAPNGSCVGLDPSKNMIDLAVLSYPEGIYSNLEFVHSKAEDMDFPSNFFDIIICTNAFMWVRQPLKVLKKIFYSLKKGGKFVLFTYAKGTPYVALFEEVLNVHYKKYAKTSAVQTMPSIEEFRSIFESNGMRFEDFSVENQVFHYKSSNDFKNYVLGWVSCYADIPENEQSNFIDRVIESLDGYNISPIAGEIEISHATISIIASKA